MAEAKEISELSGLCTSCGLCCSGVLFDFAPVEPDEVDRLTDLGLKIEDGETEGDPRRFPLPCVRFRDGLCTVYESRPSVCKQYRCEVYKAVDKGEITLTEASARISRVQQLVAKIWPMLEDASAGAAGKHWLSLLREWKARRPEDRAKESNAQLVLSLTVLNQLLDRHFRRGKDRRLKLGDLNGQPE